LSQNQKRKAKLAAAKAAAEMESKGKAKGPTAKGAAKGKAPATKGAAKGPAPEPVKLSQNQKRKAKLAAAKAAAAELESKGKAKGPTAKGTAKGKGPVAKGAAKGQAPKPVNLTQNQKRKAELAVAKAAAAELESKGKSKGPTAKGAGKGKGPVAKGAGKGKGPVAKGAGKGKRPVAKGAGKGKGPVAKGAGKGKDKASRSSRVTTGSRDTSAKDDWNMRRSNDPYDPPIKNLTRKSALLSLNEGSLDEFSDIGLYNEAFAEKHPTGSATLGPLEVVFFEPEEARTKLRKASQQLIIVFHGMHVTKGLMNEWCAINELAEWTQTGCTVAMPNIQKEADVKPEDIELVIRILMKSRKTDNCMLVGKYWGGNVCIQYALSHPRNVKGLFLVAPSGPPRIHTERLAIPTCLVSAEDDEVVMKDEVDQFKMVLDRASAQVTVINSETGGHSLAQILSDPDCQKEFRKFTHHVALRNQKKIPLSKTYESPADNLKRISLLSTESLEDINGFSLAEFQATGVRVPTGNAQIGPIECIMWKPEMINKSSGIVIVLTGLSTSKALLEEWSSVSRTWTDMGYTVMMPVFEMSSSIHKTTVSLCIDSILKFRKQNQCILVGKGWGGNCCIVYGIEHPQNVEGIVLVAPSGPVPHASKDLKSPVLLMWAKDDSTIPFAESNDILHTINESFSPTLFKSSNTGGHNFARILEKNPYMKEALSNFTACATIMSKTRHTPVTRRLSEILPDQVTTQCGMSRMSQASITSGLSQTSNTSIQREDDGHFKLLKSTILPNWLHQNMFISPLTSP